MVFEDVTPEHALATIESIAVLAALHASKAVKAALSDRIGVINRVSHTRMQE
jgi:hypothetical protein